MPVYMGRENVYHVLRSIHMCRDVALGCLRYTTREVGWRLSGGYDSMEDIMSRFTDNCHIGELFSYVTQRYSGRKPRRPGAQDTGAVNGRKPWPRSIGGLYLCWNHVDRVMGWWQGVGVGMWAEGRQNFRCYP